MSIKNIWTVLDDKLIQYPVMIAECPSINDTAAALIREVNYSVCKSLLDISFFPQNQSGNKFSLEVLTDNGKNIINSYRTELEKQLAVAPDVLYDWIYLRSVLASNINLDSLWYYECFSEVITGFSENIDSARSLARLKLMLTTDQQQSLNNLEEFAEWSYYNFGGKQEVKQKLTDYSIISNMDNHASILSRLPRNIFEIVAEKSNRELWSCGGMYILYIGEFNHDWINEFQLSL